MTEPGRSLPRGLADIVSELELRQPVVVSTSDIGRLAQQAGLKTPPAIIADRLRQRGWLLPTGTRGIYEFAPGSHAGAYGHGDPFLPFRAARASADLPAAIALQSALWLQGLSDRAPNVHELAVPARVHIPKLIEQEMRVVRYSARLEPDTIDGLPVHRVATILVQLAATPSVVRGWPTFADALVELVQVSRQSIESARPNSTQRLKPFRSSGGTGTVRDADQQILTELAGRGAAARTRLAYLVSGVAPDLAERLSPSPGASVVYFGPRQPARRFSSRFNVADTTLPFDPTILEVGIA